VDPGTQPANPLLLSGDQTVVHAGDARFAALGR
jgi:hypothetical protein